MNFKFKAYRHNQPIHFHFNRKIKVGMPDFKARADLFKYYLSKLKYNLNIIKISEIAKKNNSEFYLIIMPWPDTLNYGQTTFNWESYTNNLCFQTNCNKVINLFPKFREIKENDKDWLDFIYLKNSF